MLESNWLTSLVFAGKTTCGREAGVFVEEMQGLKAFQRPYPQRSLQTDGEVLTVDLFTWTEREVSAAMSKYKMCN